MGGSIYDYSSRSTRAKSSGYNTVSRATLDSVFTQTKEKRTHEEMNPANVKGFRECRDSENHPNSLPIQVYLDVTGSMLQVPVALIKNGLPHLMSNFIQRGIPDAAVMFGAIGDHECDNAPLQVGQFESGDEELDLWLTRTYLESGGGSNAGESYGLAWYFGANHVVTDAKEKRGKKGYIFTIGDEPALLNYSGNAIKEIMGSNATQVASNYTLETLYNAAKQDNHVFHIHVNHTRDRRTNLQSIMGEDLIVVNSEDQIAEAILNKVLSVENLSQTSNTPVTQVVDNKKEEILW